MLENLPMELGRVLKGQRAGIENIVYHRLLATRKVPRINIHSTAFANMERIPVRFSADGSGVSPPLDWHSIPEDATALTLVVEDADSPTPHPLVHAIAVNLDPERRSLPENALTSTGDDEPAEVSLGINSLLKRGWLPLDPPPGHGEHRYAFQLFALRSGPLLPGSAGRHEVYEAIIDRAIAAGCLLGTYERPRRIDVADSANESVVVGAELTGAIST